MYNYRNTKIEELTIRHRILVLGRPMKIEECRPARRGGDFYELIAVSPDLSGRIHLEVDRNTRVLACRDDIDNIGQAAVGLVIG
jgi:hypothetical protein